MLVLSCGRQERKVPIVLHNILFASGAFVCLRRCAGVRRSEIRRGLHQIVVGSDAMCPIHTWLHLMPCIVVSL